MSTKHSVLVITHIPSPYQVELFNGIHSSGQCDLDIWYIKHIDGNRLWKPQILNHKHFFLDDGIIKKNEIIKKIETYDLVVFGYYQEKLMLELMYYRDKIAKPWCFWGERPGYNQLGKIGSIYRRWKLSILHRSNAPIWGIGSLAVKMYQKEFGMMRNYFNFPYYSDINRFGIKSNTNTDSHLTFLFSGSLIRRKGIHILAKAFKRIVNNGFNARLLIMGEGELRNEIELQLQYVKEKVQFIGFQQWEDLPSFYTKATVLCVPSLYDGWGLVVPEGLASGLPVISTDKTGAAIDLVSENENGWIINANNYMRLYEVMEKVCLMTSQELDVMSINAKSIIPSHSLDSGVLKFIDYTSQSIRGFNK